ncbi:MAG TPA: rhodanese-like domain-containing protein [Fibrobacter sp.]|nr:rhodanese-like domain-containing protein [Fibrobacter sp.]
MKKRILFLSFFVFVTLGCSESSSETDSSNKTPPMLKKVAEAPSARFKDVSWSEAIAMHQGDSAIFLDVRTPEEVTRGAVQSALFIPLQELERRLSEIPKDKKILVYCRSGRRSVTASSILIRAGFTDVYNVQGGYSAAPAGL